MDGNELVALRSGGDGNGDNDNNINHKNNHQNNLNNHNYVFGKEKKIKGRRQRLMTYCRSRLIDPCGVPHAPFIALIERAARCLLVAPGLLHVLVNRLDAQVGWS